MIETRNGIREIIVDEASIYESFDENSPTVASLPKGEKITVFYPETSAPSFYKISHDYNRSIVEGYILASDLSQQNFP